MFKVNNKDTRTTSVVNDVVLVFFLLTLRWRGSLALCEVINEDTRALCKTYSNFTTKTPESSFLSKFGISIGNFEQI